MSKSVVAKLFVSLAALWCANQAAWAEDVLSPWFGSADLGKVRFEVTTITDTGSTLPLISCNQDGCPKAVWTAKSQSESRTASQK